MRAMLVAVVLASTGAWAQATYLDFKLLSSAQHPFEFYVDARRPTPAGLDLAAVRTAEEQVWATWGAVACATPKAVGRGLTTGVVPNPTDAYDTFSVMPIWLDQSDPDFSFIFGGGLTSSISLPLTYAGVLQTCDTYVNMASTQAPWSLDAITPASTNDLQTFLLHEAGHCQGLGHFPNAASIMFAYIYPGQSQHVLGPGDADALCQRYPVAGAAGAPCDADGGCGGNAQLKCLAQPVTNGVQETLCSNACTLGTNATCSLPLACQSSSAFAGFTGACLLPGTSVTPVGKACTANGDCGSAIGLCDLPEPSPSGNQFWVDGYCTQSCAAGQAACPAGSACFDLTTQQLCLQSCRVGLSDCRPDYSCVATGTGTGTSGVCMPRCYADSDCADQANFFCRTCDGLCVSRGNPVGSVGDACASDATCGAGQACRTLDDSSTATFCTQQCARGCGTCPSGSTCSPLSSGDLFCLRDCTGPGTCPTGLRCADTLTGKACLPACTRDTQCPVGQSCSGGECYDPNADAGCGTLCVKPDAGHPVTPMPDAGPGGGGGSGGCGCSVVDPALFWAVAVLLVVRRRSWLVQ